MSSWPRLKNSFLSLFAKSTKLLMSSSGGTALTSCNSNSEQMKSQFLFLTANFYNNLQCFWSGMRNWSQSLCLCLMILWWWLMTIAKLLNRWLWMRISLSGGKKTIRHTGMWLKYTLMGSWISLQEVKISTLTKLNSFTNFWQEFPDRMSN